MELWSVVADSVAPEWVAFHSVCCVHGYGHLVRSEKNALAQWSSLLSDIGGYDPHRSSQDPACLHRYGIHHKDRIGYRRGDVNHAHGAFFTPAFFRSRLDGRKGACAQVELVLDRIEFSMEESVKFFTPKIIKAITEAKPDVVIHYGKATFGPETPVHYENLGTVNYPSRSVYKTQRKLISADEIEAIIELYGDESREVLFEDQLEVLARDAKDQSERMRRRKGEGETWMLEALLSDQINGGEANAKNELTRERMVQFFLVNGPLAASSTTLDEVLRTEAIKTSPRPIFKICSRKISVQRESGGSFPDWSQYDLLSSSSELNFLKPEVTFDVTILSEDKRPKGEYPHTHCVGIALETLEESSAKSLRVCPMFLEYRQNKVTPEAVWVGELKEVNLWSYLGVAKEGTLEDLLERVKEDVIANEQWPPFQNLAKRRRNSSGSRKAKKSKSKSKSKSRSREQQPAV